MTWKFFKSNWFSLALVLLLLVAIARKNINTGVPAGAPKREQAKAKTEKFTDRIASGQDEPSVLGILPEAAQSTQTMPTVDNATAIAYLRRFSNVAVGERRKFGVPASVLLACSYVNSFAGKRETAGQANNYFSLSCGQGWEGQTATINGRCLRRYDTAWESFRDFSIYFSSQDWFVSTRKACGQDWRAWVTALRDKDISDVQHFDQEMIRVIQSYRLFELDEQ